MSKAKKTYAESGVDYSKMDPIKVLAQQKAKSTASQHTAFGNKEVGASRGESAYVWEEADAYRSLVIEGLGTKNQVAHAVRPVTGKTYYDTLAQDTIAMIVNDLIVVGALPQVVNAYWALGESKWLDDEQRAQDLINGWAAACQEIGATWGGGETPTLVGTIDPETIDLAGSALGVISPKTRLVLGDKLTDGDEIVLVESSGIHANGITLIRQIAEGLPDGFATKMPNGELFGEAILKPTHLYIQLVKDLMEQELDLHYMVNITGHGWRKLMRARQAFTYEMNFVPEVQPEFTFIQNAIDATDEEMYGNYNMGAGFAIYVPKGVGEQVVATAVKHGMKAWVAGVVKEGSRKVVITPKNITFDGETLGVRA
ncbi:phosphoribosylformylglycinamidine cyclo-ligase [Candidatus Saccharibacteria bacterium]|nr:MAG: phosphoribosylformylglycinamidine cyclo-ligase [Candidatus Saccharibacteria bacterium]